MKRKCRLAIFASGNGTNLEALLKALCGGRVRAECVLAFSDRPGARALTRARRFGVPTQTLERKAFASKAAHERAIRALLDEKKVDVIALAGYMRILSPAFVRAYRNRILNVHPALLPAFPGAHAIRDAYRAKVKTTGVTVHVVTAQVDAGPIVAQRAVRIRRGESLASLEQRIHRVEHHLYPRALKRFVEGRLQKG